MYYKNIILEFTSNFTPNVSHGYLEKHRGVADARSVLCDDVLCDDVLCDDVLCDEVLCDDVAWVQREYTLFEISNSNRVMNYKFNIIIL